jgi:integrase
MMLADSKAGRPMEYQLSPRVVSLLDEARRGREAKPDGGSANIVPLPRRRRGPATGDRPVSPHGNKAASSHVIRGRTGGDQPLKGLQKIWERVRAKAGLEDVRLHDLRHSYASMAIERGAELSQVMGLLGHRNIATTMRYVHLYTDKIRESVARVEAGILGAIEEDRAKDAA